MTTIKLINYIEENAPRLKDIGVDIQRIPINVGDRHYNKLGISFKVSIFESEFSIGFFHETFDREDWMVAQTKLKSWCSRDSKKVGSKVLYKILENYQLLSRNKKIVEILK
jgi:hypothetical protein